MRISIVLTCLVSFLSLSGCGFVQRSFKSAVPPVVTVEGASASEGQDARVVYVEILTENPNPDDLPILSIAYDATIADGATSYRATGTRAGQATISRFGAQRVVIPISVPVSAIGNPTSFTIQGNLEYLRPSAIAQTLNENGLGGTTMAFKGSGQVTQ